MGFAYEYIKNKKINHEVVLANSNPTESFRTITSGDFQREAPNTHAANETNKLYLLGKLSSHEKTKLTQDVITSLSLQTGMTNYQVYDFLRDEKKRKKAVPKP